MKTKIFLTVAVGLSLCMASGCEPPTPEQQAATAAKWATEETQQPERDAFVAKLLAAKVFEKVEYREQGATIWIGFPFYALTFDDKQTFCNVVFARLSTAAKDDLVTVTLSDVHSGKAVGRCTQWGLAMD